MNTISFSNIDSNPLDEERYSFYFDRSSISFNTPLLSAVSDGYNKLISELPNLTTSQQEVLRRVFEQFLIIQKVIDPNRLKDFSYSYSADDDLILFRNTEQYLINLVIHPEEDFLLSIIEKQGRDSLTFYENASADYEQVVYRFLQ